MWEQKRKNKRQCTVTLVKILTAESIIVTLWSISTVWNVTKIYVTYASRNLLWRHFTGVDSDLRQQGRLQEAGYRYNVSHPKQILCDGPYKSFVA